jgi:antitoxin ParD1/3/4
MATVTVSLSESQQAFVDSQVAAGGFASASEYIGKLIQQAEIKKERERIDALLLEGLQSEASEMTRQDWEEIRREAMELLAKQEPA